MSRYREIADDLRRRIAAEEFPADTKLPSISDLQEQYDAPSLNTIRSAQAVLAGEGMLRRRHGDGVYVVEPEPRLAGTIGSASGADPVAIARTAIGIAADALDDARTSVVGYIVAESTASGLRFTGGSCSVFPDPDAAEQHLLEDGRQGDQVYEVRRIDRARDAARPQPSAHVGRSTDAPPDLPSGSTDARRPVLAPMEIAALRAWFSSSSKIGAAASLGISPKTLDTYITRARIKYASVDRAAPTKSGLVQAALVDGYVSLDELEPQPRG